MSAELPAGVPHPGQPAPDFALPSDSGEIVRLSDLRGKRVILYFYPKAMTSGCTVQACAFRDAMPQIEAKGAVVLGVSPDPVKDLVKFKQKENLNFPLLSDEDHAVAERYGVWGENSMYGRTYMGINRSQFIIDETGTIVDVDYKVAPKESAPEALEALG
ncbi:MAG: thioredoxin-dependent thiol peroxidase [Ardenticatenaceae bacterium]|nr:thioredoxin-dependent thiol peroxidase [Ardenticatenaceae bacterium]